MLHRDVPILVDLLQRMKVKIFELHRGLGLKGLMLIFENATILFNPDMKMESEPSGKWLT